MRATEVIASGGGTRNPALLAMLAEELPGVRLRTSDELGLPSAAKEAYTFAVLGFLTVHGLAGTDPASTGARHPRVLGSLAPGRDGLRLPPRAEKAPVRLMPEWMEPGSSHPPFTRASYGGGHDAGDSSRVVSRPRADK